jgi:hypothetical protein
MLRIIAERDSKMCWRAWWKDNPSEYEESGSMNGAVAKLLLSRDRGISMANLVTHEIVSRLWHVEMIVTDESS